MLLHHQPYIFHIRPVVVYNPYHIPMIPCYTFYIALKAPIANVLLGFDINHAPWPQKVTLWPPYISCRRPSVANKLVGHRSQQVIT